MTRVAATRPLAVLVVFLAPPAFAGTPNVAEEAKRIPGLGPLVARVQAVLKVARVLDRATETRGRTRVTAAALPEPVGMCLVTTFRVRKVRVENYLTNKVFGKEIPGRRVSATVTVDCLVAVSLDVKRIKVEPDPNSPDLVRVTLPTFDLSADFAPGADATYEVSYGKLRNKWFSRKKAEELRKTMYREAKDKAARQFAGAGLSVFRRELIRALEHELHAHFPYHRITVR